jgi:hypothetical protein
VPYRAIAAEALERWRAAHRRLEAAAPNTPAWEAAFIDEQLAKADYQQAVDDARRARTPQPPPFNEAVRSIETEQEGEQEQDAARGS